MLARLEIDHLLRVTRVRGCGTRVDSVVRSARNRGGCELGIMSTSIVIRLLPAVILAVLLLIGATPGNATGRGPATTQPGGSPEVSGEEAAIREVILRSNAQQEEAVATGDPSLMRDTATERYSEEAERINAALLDNGITRVELVDLEWGLVEIEGSSAEATAYETWAVTTRRGRTVEPPERNVYRLVQEAGTWKIDANEHPDQPQPLPGRPAQT
jgi:hypothetical protein